MFGNIRHSSHLDIYTQSYTWISNFENHKSYHQFINMNILFIIVGLLGQFTLHFVHLFKKFTVGVGI